MASLSYPDWMPKPLQSGFSMQPEDRRIAQSTVGTSFQRGFGGDVCVAEVSLTLNALQAHWLEQFERNALVQGSRWFLFPVWYAGEVQWEMCRFKTRPKVSGVNGFHSTVQFSLYVQKRSNLLPECMVQIFSCWPPCFFFELHSALARLFSTLSNVTRAKVNAALAEIYED